LERTPISGIRARPDAVVSSQSDRREEVQVDEQHEYLKVPEVAKVLRIARSRAYELVGSGEIPSVRIGRSVRVSRKELERWLEEQRHPEARQR
jgi:excisionase family DNA binding protein